jgi:hypothetical protein
MRRFLQLLAPCMLLGASSLAAEPELLFEDTFDTQLAEGWRWLRENAETWRLKDGQLQIRVEPGVADTVRNALLRAAPDRTQGAYAFEVTVTNHTPPTNQYEQAGITWYHDGQPVFKLVKELIDGDTWIIPGKTRIETPSVRLRLMVRGDEWEAQYRPEWIEDYQTAAAGKLPAPDGKPDEVSLQCYQGPADAEHWMGFDDFRVWRLAE